MAFLLYQESMGEVKIQKHLQRLISQKVDVLYQIIQVMVEVPHHHQTMELHQMTPITQEAMAATPTRMTFTAIPMYSSKQKR